MFWKKQPLPTSIAPQHLRRIARILFIDDEDMPMVDSLRQNGYNVFHKWDVASLADLEPHQFHLIFCDIEGVGGELTKEKGAGLIKAIKRELKYPIVVAYSAHSYMPGSAEETIMRECADGIIPKDSSTDEYIACIGKYGEKAFSVNRCVEMLADVMGASSSDVRKKVERGGVGALSDYKRSATGALSIVADIATMIQLAMIFAD